MFRAPFFSITSRFQVPVMPSVVCPGTTPVSVRMASARLSGIRMWLATMASSYSHQPHRVKGLGGLMAVHVKGER